VFLHLVGSAGHVVHCSASGERNINALLFLLWWDSHSSYSYHHKIMKLIILHLDSANKPSLISESAAEIRINSEPCKGINPTTRHTQARRAP
jgi:hypothetical protein